MSGPRLTRRLILEAPVPAADGAGGAAQTWTPLGAHWAEMRPGRPAPTDLAGVAAGVAAHEIVLRWAPQGAPTRPVAGQRLRDGARVFEVLGVVESDPDRRWLSVWAREGVTP